MNLEEKAEKLGLDTLQLFVRAHKMYGHMWGLNGPSEAHRIWKRTGVIPMYVLQYVHYKERQIVPVNGHRT